MKRGREDGEIESLNMVNCLMLLSKVGVTNNPSSSQFKGGGDGYGFKCKTCNRIFSSFQALGGHRASHKKPKLMLSSSQIPMKPNRMHPCPVCGLEFGIGQALGGHMRKHRVHNHKKFDLCLDLNLTPVENDHLNLSLRKPLVDCFNYF